MLAARTIRATFQDCPMTVVAIGYQPEFHRRNGGRESPSMSSVPDLQLPVAVVQGSAIESAAPGGA